MKERFFNIPIFEGKKKEVQKWYVLVIYDISDNKKRTRLAKYLNGFGFRIQLSAYEAILTREKYRKMEQGIGRIVGPEDSVRIYRIRGQGEVSIFGSGDLISDEDVVVL
ncbi:MAG: CRISPR-associated endonuclease Cas2 [Actinomycetes bacterium]|jgi:CRISPR-associated protein Cas2|nr:CRISPR-associated endonuclease Cas2 [Actinomycetes bacterium]